MPSNLIATERVHPTLETANDRGHIRFHPIKAIWLIGMMTGGFIGIAFFASWSAFLVFLILNAISLCAGHSVGMHRLLIHRSFETPTWVEHVLIYLGTLVGMAGPFGMIIAHDMRDWHQRQSSCPNHPSHSAPFLKDAFWQLCCTYELDLPPRFHLEPHIENDRFYLFLERTWMAQQIPVAFVLYLLGGWAFVLWGVCLRVAVSLIGHWAVGHIAHNRGHQGWVVKGLPVQGYNLPHLAVLTFGESLHGNHHAFPNSALFGVERGQTDLGFLFVRGLESFGLAKNVQLPDSFKRRPGLTRVDPVTSCSAVAERRT